MAGSVNKVILIGNLGRDPEARSFQNGGKVVNLNIATSETWKDKATGERKEKTEWHSVAIFNENLARLAEDCLRKGSKVYIEGQLQTRKWQGSDGQDRYTTEIVLQNFNGTLVLLDRQKEQSDYKDEARERKRQGNGAGGFRAPANSASGELDDDVPFATTGGVWAA